MALLYARKSVESEAVRDKIGLIRANKTLVYNLLDWEPAF
jgi:hypothetical protein